MQDDSDDDNGAECTRCALFYRHPHLASAYIDDKHMWLCDDCFDINTRDRLFNLSKLQAERLHLFLFPSLWDGSRGRVLPITVTEIAACQVPLVGRAILAYEVDVDALAVPMTYYATMGWLKASDKYYECGEDLRRAYGKLSLRLQRLFRYSFYDTKERILRTARSGEASLTSSDLASDEKSAAEIVYSLLGGERKIVDIICEFWRPSIAKAQAQCEDAFQAWRKADQKRAAVESAVASVVHKEDADEVASVFASRIAAATAASPVAGKRKLAPVTPSRLPLLAKRRKAVTGAVVSGAMSGNENEAEAQEEDEEGPTPPPPPDSPCDSATASDDARN